MPGITRGEDNDLISKTIRLDRVSVDFQSAGKTVRVVDDVRLTFKEKRITGIIGETGSGKSVLGLSLLQLLPGNARVTGHIHYRGDDVLSYGGSRLRRLRAKEIALVPQNPATSLNPIMAVRRQIREAVASRGKIEKPGITQRINTLFNDLHLDGLASPGAFYPFELSGGMKQRVLTAMGICRDPAWILADEPTKGLDACLRSEVCALLERHYASSGPGMIIVTHDLSLARRLCCNIVVMYCGQVIETAPAPTFFSGPAHPYSAAFLKSSPREGFVPIPGEVPSVLDPPGGCRFHPRCRRKLKICRDLPPSLLGIGPGQAVRCHRYA